MGGGGSLERARVPVGIPLAVHLGHDVLVVVVAQGAAQLVVVHVGLGLALPPAPRHLVRVHQLTTTRQGYGQHTGSTS